MNWKLFLHSVHAFLVEFLFLLQIPKIVMRLNSTFLCKNSFTKTSDIYWCNTTWDSTQITDNISTLNHEVAWSKNDRAVAPIKIQNFGDVAK